MDRKRLLVVGTSLTVNALTSWTLLPLVIPPFRIYVLSELVETLLWQGIGAVGWPLAILGATLSLLFGGQISDLGSLLLTLVYPGILFLIIRVLTARSLRLWHLVLLHFLLTLSFAAVWWHVLNGYEFMIG
jgi:hypothetical protein